MAPATLSEAKSYRRAIKSLSMGGRRRHRAPTTRCEPRGAPMNSADSFSATYAEARDKFVEAAGAAGGALERIANPNRRPDGGDISTDVAWFGPRSAEKVLVMVSGTHGAEGFCGSGAQVDWLRRGEAARLPKDTAALLVHAI